MNSYYQNTLKDTIQIWNEIWVEIIVVNLCNALFFILESECLTSA